MTGLLAGPLTDAAGLDAVRADLASAVQQVLEPARVSLRISQCDRVGHFRTWHVAPEGPRMTAKRYSRYAFLSLCSWEGRRWQSRATR